MKLLNLKTTTMILALIAGFTSCKKDEDGDSSVTVVSTTSYDYNFNNGQLVPAAAYEGTHMDNILATMKVDELSNGKTTITVTLENTVEGQTYMVHAHDAADPSTTPNNTPYNETPNADVFTQMIAGNGSSASASQTIDMSYADVNGTYEGFFVVHDPMQAINTADISTYLVVGSFARTQADYTLKSKMVDYDFNTGQVAAAYAYSGTHATDLSAKLKIQELGDGSSRVSVWVMNSKDGEMYMIHAHDAADPATTPNMTPYDETPNSGLCTLMATGNGSTVGASQMSTMSFMDITTTYDGFFVIHDPLQSIDTTDPTTYVVLGTFAK